MLQRLRISDTGVAVVGRDVFLTAESDSHDIAALAVINLVDLVVRKLLDNSRLWLTVTVHAPALIDTIESALTDR